MRYIILIFFTLFKSLLGFSQSYNLQQLIELGIGNNLNLQIAEQNVEHQKILVNTAKEKPKAFFEMQYGNIQNPGINDYLVAGEQSFELPKVYKLRKDLLLSNVNLVQARREIIMGELKFQIRTLYNQLSYLDSYKKVLNEEVLKWEELSQISKSKIEAGEIDKSDLLNIELKINEIKNKINRADFEVENLKPQLFTILNTSNDVELDYSDNDFLPLTENLGLENNPQVLWQKQQIENVRFQTNLQQQSLLPQFRLGLGNLSFGNLYRQFYVSGGMEVPIFNKSFKARIEASKLSEKVAEKELSLIEKRLENEVLAYKNKWMLNQQLYENLKNELLPQATLLTERNRKKFLAGSIEYLDWYLPYNQYFGYRNELLNIKKEINQNYYIIKYLTGNE
jgi:heavy metal efflux system protein